MIRVVLTVLVAVALPAASMPALEDARVSPTDDRPGTASDRVERAIGGSLSRSLTVSDPSPAPRPTLRIRAPARATARLIGPLALRPPKHPRLLSAPPSRSRAPLFTPPPVPTPPRRCLAPRPPAPPR
ncbi:DUF7311 family protein, partial [Halorubrum lacusprofundi]